jgi:methionine-rich copper-binding protein CopC
LSIVRPWPTSQASTVPAAPPNLTLNFSQGVETQFSSVIVKAANGVRVDKNDPHAAPGNPKRLLLALQPLQPGAYQVQWHVTPVDTHKTQGAFTFTVAQ